MHGKLVSIPFIAGQWSLREPAVSACDGDPGAFQSPSLRGSGRFRRDGNQRGAAPHVSIPFIAGQWSLPAPAGVPSAGARRVSIPFIAGQWSLPPETSASWLYFLEVSIPFIAGQWSLRAVEALPAYRCGGVSIPFIAGQWSLPRKRDSSRTAGAGFNPLHCGAVVASQRALF